MTDHSDNPAGANEASSKPSPSPAPPSAILETCLYVGDLARSRSFYAGLFGYAVMKADARFCAFAVTERQVLILFQRGGDPSGTTLPFGFIPPHGANGRAHLGLAIPADSLASWKRRLADRGVLIESEFVWPGGGASVYFRDPDGHLLELLTPGVWPTY